MRAFLKAARLALGFLLCALGTCLEIHAGLGSSPWSVFHQGLSRLTGLTFGQATILCSVTIVLIVRLAGLKIGVGTLLNMVVIGKIIDAIDAAGLVPAAGSIPAGVLMLLLSMLLGTMGGWLYIGCGLGCGPRDGLMSLLTEKSGLPVGAVRAGIEGTALVTGMLMGGTAGAGTVLTVLCIGPVVGAFYKLVRFDITAVRHETALQTLRHLAGK